MPLPPWAGHASGTMTERQIETGTGSKATSRLAGQAVAAAGVETAVAGNRPPRPRQRRSGNSQLQNVQTVGVRRPSLVELSVRGGDHGPRHAGGRRRWSPCGHFRPTAVAGARSKQLRRDGGACCPARWTSAAIPGMAAAGLARHAAKRPPMRNQRSNSPGWPAVRRPCRRRGRVIAPRQATRCRSGMA